ncbi:hypothetical protein PFISCL1PPCAC_26289, partial [Pristionchus fissidentatus]
VLRLLGILFSFLVTLVVIDQLRKGIISCRDAEWTECIRNKDNIARILLPGQVEEEEDRPYCRRAGAGGKMEYC